MLTLLLNVKPYCKIKVESNLQVRPPSTSVTTSHKRDYLSKRPNLIMDDAHDKESESSSIENIIHLKETWGAFPQRRTCSPQIYQQVHSV